MEALQSLPAWAQVVLALLAAAILIVLNVGWLLAAKGMLNAQRRKNHGPGVRGQEPGNVGDPRRAPPTTDP